MRKIPLLVIFGPTSVGKTKTAIALAKRVNAEIISADSRQVYRQMDIGTDKPAQEERQEIPHHLLDVVNPDQSFTLADYVSLAWKAIGEIHARGKIPMLVGSAGLYLRAVCEGYVFPVAPPDEQLRNELSERIRTEGPEPLYRELCEMDPEGSKNLDFRNPRRLIRFFEIVHQTGRLPSEFWKLRDPRAENLAVTKFGLIRQREKIHERILERVGEQEKRGLLEEARRLLAHYSPRLKAFQTHSYQELFPYLEGMITWEECKSLIIKHTFQYARRQWIWFKKEKRVNWIEAEPFGQWQELAGNLERTWATSHLPP